MIRYLIATHGYLADGFKSTLKVIMGEEITKQIVTLNLFVEDNQQSEDAKTLIGNFFENIQEDDQIIVFTDILHGSVNQLVIPYINSKKVHVLTGINLPLICEVMSTFGYIDQAIDEEKLKLITDEAQKELRYVNEYKNKKIKQINDDSSFFD